MMRCLVGQISQANAEKKRKEDGEMGFGTSAAQLVEQLDGQVEGLVFESRQFRPSAR